MYYKLIIPSSRFIEMSIAYSKKEQEIIRILVYRISCTNTFPPGTGHVRILPKLLRHVILPSVPGDQSSPNKLGENNHEQVIDNRTKKQFRLT